MQARAGETVCIAAVEQCGAYRRLLDFGFTPGTEVTVRNVAIGGTMLVALRGYTLALRANAGKHVVVTRN
ncbi:MAG: ferrous iron transport protein A [Firmicutes bacterium]|nr:ferrous iron transport protein A [Bacillota bacterium]